MLPVDEARRRILAGLSATAAEIVPLAEAWGRVAAEDLRARVTQPPRDVSAMDGFALRAADGIPGARLRIVGSAPAGHPWDGVIGPGEAVRIFTGSIIPAGSDTVLLQEEATTAEDRVTVNETTPAGRHIRRTGQDFAVGDVLVATGKRFGARDVGLAASGNAPWVAVRRRPRIAILATGDEIALPGEPIPPGGIVSSNAHALAALVRATGGEPLVLPIAPDELEAIASASDAARGADMLVTTGGASVGDHDLIQPALAARGMQLDFWKIAMRPGKPLLHGHVRGLPVLGLPGNPVSAMVCAVLFLLPALAKMLGQPPEPPPTDRAVLGTGLPANDHRADHLRATLRMRPDGMAVATPFARQDSAMLRLLTQAEALILRAPHAPALAEGADVEVIRLDRLGL